MPIYEKYVLYGQPQNHMFSEVRAHCIVDRSEFSYKISEISFLLNYRKLKNTKIYRILFVYSGILCITGSWLQFQVQHS